MACGDIYEATAGSVEDLQYVDVGLFDSPKYGSVYIIDGPEPALVDTGTGYRYEIVLEALDTLDIGREDLSSILLTHVHLDHAGGASPISQACPNADVYVHEAGARFLRDPADLWAGTKAVLGDRISYYRKPEPIPEDRLRTVTDGETIALGDRTLDVHHAPGHAFHQIVFHDRQSDGVFTGDAAGIYVPQTDSIQYATAPPGFDLEECLEDIAMLEALDPAALYYGHFGDQPTGNRLDEYRQLLTAWVEDVSAKREELADDDAVLEYFADHAETANVWTGAHARGEEEINVAGVLNYLDENDGRT